MTDSELKRLVAVLEANWRTEMEGHYTYEALANVEDDPQRRNALRGLAAAEKRVRHSFLVLSDQEQVPERALAFSGKRLADRL